jgi:hypothetical protein
VAGTLTITSEIMDMETQWKTLNYHRSVKLNLNYLGLDLARQSLFWCLLPVVGKA